MISRRYLIVILFSAAALLASSQLTPAEAQSSKGKKTKLIRLDALKVEGKIQKPMAMYILNRSVMNFKELDRTESFLPKIVESVDKPGF